MKSNRINKLLMGVLAAIVLLIGVGSVTADAQVRGLRRPRRVIFYRPYHPFWWHNWETTYRVVDPIAALKEEGYSDGRSQGKEDAKEGNDNDPENHKQYSKSKSHAYREAFLKGYLDGYRKQMKKAD